MSPELTVNAQKSILEGKPHKVSGQIFNSYNSDTRLFNTISCRAYINGQIFPKNIVDRQIKIELQDGAGRLNNKKGQFLGYNETFNLVNVLPNKDYRKDIKNEQTILSSLTI